MKRPAPEKPFKPIVQRQREVALRAVEMGRRIKELTYDSGRCDALLRKFD